MQMPVMPDLDVTRVIWLIAFFGSIVFAFWQDRRERQAHPHLRPYRWGYFLGMMGLVAGMTIVMSLALEIDQKQSPQRFTIWVGILLTGVLIAFPAILRRQRRGWILVCLFFLLTTRLSMRNGFQPADSAIIIVAGMNIIYTVLQWKHLGRKARERLLAPAS